MPALMVALAAALVWMTDGRRSTRGCGMSIGLVPKTLLLCWRVAGDEEVLRVGRGTTREEVDAKKDASSMLEGMGTEADADGAAGGGGMMWCDGPRVASDMCASPMCAW